MRSISLINKPVQNNDITRLEDEIENKKHVDSILPYVLIYLPSENNVVVIHSNYYYHTYISRISCEMVLSASLFKGTMNFIPFTLLYNQLILDFLYKSGINLIV